MKMGSKVRGDVITGSDMVQKTSNAQRPTSNAQFRRLWRCLCQAPVLLVSVVDTTTATISSVPTMKSFLKYWLPVLIWLGFIFIGSTDLMSAEHTSRIIAPLLRWLKPDISPEAIAQVQFFVRKAAHVTEYAILAMLLWRGLRRGTNLQAKMSPDPAKLGSSFATKPVINTSMQTEGAGRSSLVDSTGCLWVRSRSILFVSVWIACGFFAASDEFHQSFVVSRTASPIDVVIDICGALIGLAICWAFAARRRSGN